MFQPHVIHETQVMDEILESCKYLEVAIPCLELLLDRLCGEHSLEVAQADTLRRRFDALFRSLESIRPRNEACREFGSGYRKEDPRRKEVLEHHQTLQRLMESADSILRECPSADDSRLCNRLRLHFDDLSIELQQIMRLEEELVSD